MSITRFRARTLTVLALSAVFLVPHATNAADPQGTANVQLVKNFLAEVRVAAMSDDAPRRVRAVAEKYMAEDYIQHAENYPPGREGYIQFMSTALKQQAGNASSNNQPRPNDRFFFGDGEYVVWVAEMPSSSGKQPKYLFSMIRVVNGKLKEHWDGG